MPIANMNGMQLSFVEKGKGPLVILLHGFPDTVKTWDRMIPALVGAKYRVVALHMRGYPPTSVAPDGKYMVRDLAMDVLALIDALGGGPAFLVGHDWGAMAAYAAAIMAPAKVRGIVTSGLPPIRVYRQGLREKLHRPHHIYLAWHGLSAWIVRRRNFREIDHLYRKWAPHFRPKVEHMLAVKTALGVKGRTRAAVEYYSKPMTHADHHEFSAKLSVPGLIFYGYDEPRVRREMFRRAPSAFTQPPEMVVLPNVGHWPHLEAPERVEDETVRFLDRVSGR